MKASLFIPDMGGGGAERVTANLANGLVVRGISCDLVLARARGPLLDVLDPRVRVFDLKAGRTTTSILPLMRYLRRERPDCLVSALDHANIVAIVASRLSMTGVKVAVTVHITRSQAELNARNASKELLLGKLMKVFYPYSDAVVAVSVGAAHDLSIKIGMDLARIHVIYNPIVESSMFEMSKALPEHHWFCGGKVKVILAIGRLTKQKNFPGLIEAFYEVRKRIPDSRLIILGEGEERKALESLVRNFKLSDSVWMPGFIPNPYSYISRCSLFVLSSLYEALPTVLIEALALGAPIVSTNCPHGPNEILTSGKYGKLVPVGDTNCLAEAMYDTLIGKSKIPPSEDAWAPFTVEQAVDKYIVMVNSICNKTDKRHIDDKF